MSGRATVRVSVRAVVETTLHESDLSPAALSARRMREGAAAHRLRQSEGVRTERAYRAETALSADYEGETLTLHVTGRADALLEREDGMAVVEEIKLGEADSPLHEAHRAQAAMYGHMLCTRDGLSAVCLRVLYVDTSGGVLVCYEQEAAAQALRAEFDALCAPCAAWEERILLRQRARDESLAALPFPFAAYREGQRRFAGSVYVAVRDRKRLFAQAPTGIGKTMAALYPALRAAGEGLCARVLFLTARTTGRRSAMDALARLGAAGARLLSVEIAAKDKVCVLERRDCRPQVCPRARGFYDRLPAALEEALGRAGEPGGMRYTAQEAADLAARHALCPFELTLALAALADAVVCDVNYVYDPFVAVEGLVPGAALLVDEAHQLAGRVRDACSAVADAQELTLLRRSEGKENGRKTPLYRALTRALSALSDAALEPEFASGRMKEPPAALDDAMEAVRDAAAESLSKGRGGAAVDVLSLTAAWGLARSRLDERYAVLTQGEGRSARVELLCLCAAPEILAASRRTRGTVYFSATLAPFDAAAEMLGSREGDMCLSLPSPFDPARLEARIAPIDVRYAQREQNAPAVAQAIAEHLRAHPGNALIFFPSYRYMETVMGLLEERELPGTALLRERRGMGEEERRALLAAFEPGAPSRAAVAAVLGGALSEGIDLPGERLQNVIVVSTGAPQPDARTQAMRAYFDGLKKDGFFLCMTWPGMVRVVQAAGRLIRTHEDTGALLLIDSRYAQGRIRALLEGTLIGDALRASF